MEDQGKRLLLAVGISMVLVLGWQFLQPKPQPKPAPVATATTPGLDAGVAPAPGATTVPGATTAPGAAAVAGAPAADATKPGEPALPACDATTAHTETLQTKRVRAVFSECGGALASWRMVDTEYTQGEGKKKEPLDLVARPGQPTYYPLQVGFPESTVNVDGNSHWTLTRKSDTELEASWHNDKLEVTKTYTLKPDAYAMGLKVAFKNLGAQEIDQQLDLTAYGYQDPGAKAGGTFSYAAPHYDVACQMAGNHPAEDQLKDLSDAPKARAGDLDWAGINHRYFLLAMAPHSAKSEQLGCYNRSYSADPGMVSSSVRFPSVKLAPGAASERTFTIYAGPKLVDHLERVSAETGDGAFDKAIALGMLSFLVRPMLWLLKFLQGFVGNWGLAIILLTITVKLITLYWTTKSMRSMKAMSKLKPKMDEIRTKFESDKQRMNVEMMNLYKTHNINPLGGCLPMVLQMPVWFALYRALNVSAELYQAPFVGWLNDLTRPDPYYIVPVVMTGLMFVQQKITPSTVDSAQQRMMLIIMPLMFGSFSLFFPSGLTVYILTNTLLTMAHQFWMNNTDPDKSKTAAVAASTASESAPKTDGDAGKGGKSGGRGQGGGRKKQAKA
jgi:YidC/Oxa1 family membrane protein insertase